MRNPVRFYLDQHVSAAVRDGLRRRGIDVLTTQEANRCSNPDEEQLHFALTQGRVLFTHDTDFIRLNAEGRKHAGVVYVKQGELSLGDILRGLVLVYEVLSADDMQSHIEFL